MTSALHLEYLENLQHLPIQLQKKFKLMRHLDDLTHGLLRKIDLISDELLPNIIHMDDEMKEKKVNIIKSLYLKAEEYGDDKVQLAIQTYELVDKHIRRLDAELSRFEFEIQRKVMSARAGTVQATNSTTVKKGRKKNSKVDDKTTVTTGKKERAGPSNVEGAVASGSSTAITVKKQGKSGDLDSVTGMAHPSDVLDMPVDPNEPTYCLCQQVSYGEMIGCDNPNCQIEWFHFTCVGLEIKPEGQWYCPKCTQDRKKKSSIKPPAKRANKTVSVKKENK